MTQSDIPFRPPAWLEPAARGDFSALPPALPWDAAAPLAFLINGYVVAGGHAEAASIHRRVVADLTDRGTTFATTMDLWTALFFSHRCARFVWGERSPAEAAVLDRLCAILRDRLVSLEPAALAEVTTALKTGRGARWP